MTDDLRNGEASIDLPPPDDARLRFIGTIRTPFSTRADCPRQGDPENGPDCRLELEPEWQDALDGVEKFDFLDVLYWLDRSRRDLVRQSPRPDAQGRGTFSLRSPVRPNPIGLSHVRLIRREGGALIVRGLDCIDGTPLLDIKPDSCAYTPLAPPKTPA